jgi:hypothetical protein
MVEIASFGRKKLLFHNYSTFPCGLDRKIFRTRFLKQRFSERRSETNNLRYGTVNFEERKHPRFNVDLPIEYGRAHLSVEDGHAINGIEVGWVGMSLNNRLLAEKELFIKKQLLEGVAFLSLVEGSSQIPESKSQPSLNSQFEDAGFIAIISMEFQFYRSFLHWKPFMI